MTAGPALTERRYSCTISPLLRDTTLTLRSRCGRNKVLKLPDLRRDAFTGRSGHDADQELPPVVADAEIAVGGIGRIGSQSFGFSARGGDAVERVPTSFIEIMNDEPVAIAREHCGNG